MRQSLGCSTSWLRWGFHLIMSHYSKMTKWGTWGCHEYQRQNLVVHQDEREEVFTSIDESDESTTRLPARAFCSNKVRTLSHGVVLSTDSTQCPSIKPKPISKLRQCWRIGMVLVLEKVLQISISRLAWDKQAREECAVTLERWNKCRGSFRVLHWPASK